MANGSVCSAELPALRAVQHQREEVHQAQSVEQAGTLAIQVQVAELRRDEDRGDIAARRLRHVPQRVGRRDDVVAMAGMCSFWLCSSRPSVVCEVASSRPLARWTCAGVMAAKSARSAGPFSYR